MVQFPAVVLFSKNPDFGPRQFSLFYNTQICATKKRPETRNKPPVDTHSIQYKYYCYLLLDGNLLKHDFMDADIEPAGEFTKRTAND
jgi:hypothetical protein